MEISHHPLIHHGSDACAHDLRDLAVSEFGGYLPFVHTNNCIGDSVCLRHAYDYVAAVCLLVVVREGAEGMENLLRVPAGLVLDPVRFDDRTFDEFPDIDMKNHVVPPFQRFVQACAYACA